MRRKKISLGDRRCFFVPWPRAIRDLTQLVLNKNNDFNSIKLFSGHKVKECAILSNYSRLGVLIAMEEHQSSSASGNVNSDHAPIPRTTSSLAAKLAVSKTLK